MSELCATINSYREALLPSLSEFSKEDQQLIIALINGELAHEDDIAYAEELLRGISVPPIIPSPKSHQTTHNYQLLGLEGNPPNQKDVLSLTWKATPIQDIFCVQHTYHKDVVRYYKTRFSSRSGLVLPPCAYFDEQEQRYLVIDGHHRLQDMLELLQDGIIHPLFNQSHIVLAVTENNFITNPPQAIHCNELLST